MKLKMIYTFFALAMGSFLFYSSSGGPGMTQGADRTGSPVAIADGSGFCGNSGCHASNAFSPNLTITVSDGTGEVSTYEPGATYTVKVTVTDDGNGSTYGYQAVALDEMSNSVGDFTDFPTGQQTLVLADRTYIEHSTPSAASGFEFTWTAPAEGTGDVTFYSAGISANGTGSASGDGSALNDLTLSEMVSSVFQVETLPIALDVYPNPVQDQLNLSIQSDISGAFSLNILDLNGQLLHKEQLQLSAMNNQQQINVSNLPAGSYLLQITDGTKMVSKKIVKL